MHEFDSGEKDAGTAKILEAEHWSGLSFDSTVVLLNDVVEVLDLTYEDRLPSSDVHGFQSRHIRAALINGHFLWRAVSLNRLFEEPACRGLVAMCPQQEINGVTCLINSTVQLLPLAPNLDVCLVHPPAPPDPALGASERLLQDWQQLDRPAVHRRVIDRDPPLGNHLFHMPKTQRISAIPTNTEQNHIQRMVQAL